MFVDETPSLGGYEVRVWSLDRAPSIGIWWTNKVLLDKGAVGLVDDSWNPLPRLLLKRTLNSLWVFPLFPE